MEARHTTLQTSYPIVRLSYARRQFLLERRLVARRTKHAKARSFTVPELQRTVEQLNAKLVEFTAAQVELPKAKSKMRKQDLVLQLEGEVRLAYSTTQHYIGESIHASATKVEN